jgi:hypothetical protein
MASSSTGAASAPPRAAHGDDAAADEREALLQLAAAHLFAHGFAMVPPTREPGHMLHIPFALLPRKVRE